MGIDRFNSEGYSDPVPYEAISRIEREQHKWRPLVYICSPYAGDISGNTQRARRFSRFAVDSGAIPLAPHLLLPQYISETSERELAMHMNMVLLGKCEEGIMWVILLLNIIQTLNEKRQKVMMDKFKRIFHRMDNTSV